MATAAERGRGAERPSHIPRAGWRDILIRTQMFRRRGGGTPAARNRQPSSGSAHCCGPGR
jgi:hypothetical protein